MARACRAYVQGGIYHITQRCHKREFLLRYQKDRDRYRYWLYQAKKRYNLIILNYMITCNHIHLLIKDNEPNDVSRGMALVSGCMGREYNRHNNRRGAFWEDRYQISIVESEAYLFRCFIYIDLNMVRAGVVQHPKEWQHCGYYDLYSGRTRYHVLNFNSILTTLGYSNLKDFKLHHQELVQSALAQDELIREPLWTERKIIS
jgi:putative transposase